MGRESDNLPNTRSSSLSRLLSGIVGALLLGVAILWMGWLLLTQHGVPVLPSFSFPGAAPTTPPVVQIAPLTAEGITLGYPTQKSLLTQQQAVLIANSLEPDASTKAKSTSAQYVLLNYPNTGTSASHPEINNVPVWMISYLRIPLEPADASVDPTPFPHSYHDLYVFLDANSGKELLSIWI